MNVSQTLAECEFEKTNSSKGKSEANHSSNKSENLIKKINLHIERSTGKLPAWRGEFRLFWITRIRRESHGNK